MKITLDATALLSRKFGIGFYADNLIRALARVDADHGSENQYALLYQFARTGDKDFYLPEDAANFRRCLRRMPHAVSDVLFNRMGWNGDRFCGRPDLFHALRNFLPRFGSAKSVWTLFDLAFKINPDWFTDRTARALDERVKQCLDRADHVITISEHTRKDLIDIYGYPAERSTAIPLGVSHHAAAEQASLRSVQPDHAPPAKKPYLLYVGTLEPRKNIVRIIEAYSALSTDHELVLVGARGWKYEEIFRAIERSPRKDTITWLDYADHEVLQSLYRHADIFIYPSLYEGFGLPVLEAMSHGCPVITSNVSSLPEVAGDAAVYVSPENTAELAEKMESLILDPARRDELSRRGRIRAGLFTWEKTARKTIEVYRRISS